MPGGERKAACFAGKGGKKQCITGSRKLLPLRSRRFPWARYRQAELSFWPEGLALIISVLLILAGGGMLYRSASISNHEIILYDGGIRGRAVQEAGTVREKERYVDFDISLEDVRSVSCSENAVIIKSHEKNLRALCETEKTARDITMMIHNQMRDGQILTK